MEESKSETLTYYQRNRERCLAKAKEYRTKHKEKYQQYWKTYYEKKKQELMKKRMEYAKKNRDKIYERNRTIYYPKHYAKVKALKQKTVREVSENKSIMIETNETVEEVRSDLPAVLDPTVFIPASTIIVSSGNHVVSWE